MTSFGKVVGRYVSGLYNNGIPIPAQGVITFTPQAEYILSSGEQTTLPVTVTAVLDSNGYISTPMFSMKTRKILYDMNGNIRSGQRGVTLAATDDPNSNPRNWTWRADFKLTALGEKIKYNSFSFSLPAGGEVDLTQVTPVPGMTGYSTIAGPKGDSVKFLPEQNPQDIQAPDSGTIVPFDNTLYGFSDGEWTELGTLSAPESVKIQENGINLTATKMAGGLVNLTGTVSSDTPVFGHIDSKFAPQEELTTPVYNVQGTKSAPFTIFPNGSFQVTEPGDYSIVLTYPSGGN